MVAFNLGYLPGAPDKLVTTTSTNTTVEAVEAALEVGARGVH